MSQILMSTDLVEIHNLGTTHYLMADGRRIPPACCTRGGCLKNVVFSQVPERAKIDADPPAGRPQRLAIVPLGAGLDRDDVAGQPLHGETTEGATPKEHGSRPSHVEEAALEKSPRSDSTIPAKAGFQMKAGDFSPLEAAAARAEESGRDVDRAGHPLVNPRAPAHQPVEPAKPEPSERDEKSGLGGLPGDLSDTMDNWFGKTRVTEGESSAESTGSGAEADTRKTRKKRATQPRRSDRRSRAARQQAG